MPIRKNNKNEYIKSIAILIFFLLALLLSINAKTQDQENAVLLYDQPLQDEPKTGFFSNHDKIGAQIGADQFRLNVDGNITNVTWYGYYGIDLQPNVSAVDFSISFFTDAGFVPASIASYEQIVSAKVSDTGFHITDTSTFHFGRTIYKFEADLATPFSVKANDIMWISIAEADSRTPRSGSTQWLWSYSSFSSNDTKAFRSGTDDLEWTLSNQYGQFAFSLTESDTSSPPSALTIFPPSGTIVTTSTFDLTLIVEAPGLKMVSGNAIFDGTDITTNLSVRCNKAGTLMSGGQTLRCPGLTGANLAGNDLDGQSTHTLDVTINLNDGTSISDTVIWNILANIEP